MDHKTTIKSKHLHWCQLLGIAPSTWHLVTQWFYRMTLWRMILLSSPYRWAKWGPASPNKKPTVPQAVSGTTAHTKQPGFAASALEHHTFLLHLSPREISWQSPVNISLHWLSSKSGADRPRGQTDVFKELGEGQLEGNAGPLLGHHHTRPDAGEVDSPGL